MANTELSFGEVIAEEMDKAGEEISTQASQESEPSLEQMREKLGEGGKELSDEDLQKMWDDTKEVKEDKVDEDGNVIETPEGKKEGVEEKVDEVVPEPLTFKEPDELFDHKLSLTIDGQEREGTIAEFLRMAQRAPMSDRRLNEVTGQRNELSTENERLVSEGEKAEQDFKWVKWMLEDESGARFMEMRQKFQAGQFQGPEVVAPVTEVSTEAAGQKHYQDYVRPAVQKIVREYSQDGKATTAEEAQFLEKKFEEVLSQKIELEGRFLTMQRLEDLVHQEIPQMIEQEGWRKVEGATPIAPVVTPTVPVQSFRSFNERGQVVSGNVDPELNAVKAELSNLRRDMTKAKLNAAPSSGGEGGPVDDTKASFSDRVGKADSAAAVFDLLNDEHETFGM